MSTNTLALPPKPQPPDPGECCGGGACHPCVYDAYEQALVEWRQQVERLQAQPGGTTTEK
ncbi:MAG: oxidoreductase-like domain-containing protein [Nevskiales bacterium]